MRARGASTAIPRSTRNTGVSALDYLEAWIGQILASSHSIHRMSGSEFVQSMLALWRMVTVHSRGGE
jgi:hypothetical protein